MICTKGQNLGPVWTRDWGLGLGLDKNSISIPSLGMVDGIANISRCGLQWEDLSKQADIILHHHLLLLHVPCLIFLFVSVSSLIVSATEKNYHSI